MTDLKLFYIKPDSTMPEEHQRKMWGVALNWTSTSKTFHGLGTKKDSEPSIENIIEAANECLQAASEFLKHDVPDEGPAQNIKHTKKHFSPNATRFPMPESKNPKGPHFISARFSDEALKKVGMEPRKRIEENNQ